MRLFLIGLLALLTVSAGAAQAQGRGHEGGFRAGGFAGGGFAHGGGFERGGFRGGYGPGPAFGRPGFERPGFGRPGFGRPGFGRPGFEQPAYGRGGGVASPGWERRGYPGERGGYGRSASGGYRGYTRGQFLPPSYWGGAVADPRLYHLRRPPNGYGWVTVGPNAYLTQRSTGLILDTAPLY